DSPSETVVAAQKTRQAAMARAAQATIAVFGLEGGGGGSGVIITPDGYALTNFHVTSACGDHMRVGLSDGRMVDAVIVGIDATGDVSLIKLLGSHDFPTAPLADSDKVRVGQWCFAAGNPFGLATNLQPSISLGMVSGTGRYQYPAGTLLEYADCIQTDAAINPGNSGGPLFNLAGEVIGINGRCSFEKRGRVNVGVGYAISINQIKNFLGMLRSGRLVDHATLGATVATDESGKVLISNILNGSDAYRRGLRYGDEVVSFAGREIGTTNDFKNVLGTLPKDWRVPITIRRDGKEQTLLVRLMGVHTEQQLIKLVAGESPEKSPHRGRGEAPGEKEGDEKEGDAQEENQGKPQGDEPAKKAERGDSSREAQEEHKEAGDDEGSSVPGKPNFKLVKSMLEPREGFANYYFNRLERHQVWARLEQLGNFEPLDGAWQFSGKVAGETTPAVLDLDEDKGRLEVGKRKLEIPFGDEMAAVADQNGDEGLLVAMRAWQQLLQLGPEQLGATIYLGTAPIYPGLDKSIADMQICDVLQSNWYDCLVRFYIPVGTNEVRAIEVYGESTRDPVEVILDEYREDDGRRWPGRARLQYGVEPRLLITLDAIKADGRATAPSNESSSEKASSEKDSSPKASAKKAQPKHAPAKDEEK
ncbi:MAG: trypsin-like peptidase domain-containing protein, partial [Aureliella sp.]